VRWKVKVGALAHAAKAGTAPSASAMDPDDMASDTAAPIPKRARRALDTVASFTRSMAVRLRLVA
jgi:hypothetical protein